MSFSVIGAPSGVSVTVGNIQTSGTATTALLTIVVDLATSPGVYSLIVTGQRGAVLSDATATFALTVEPAGDFTPAHDD